MNQKFTYKHFNQFVLRTPLFSYSSIVDIISKRNISGDDLKRIYKNPLVQEAIFLASPDLHTELQKWINNKEIKPIKSAKSKKAHESLHLALLKYILRMSSRCTPFGLFAGFSMGNFDKKTNIKLRAQSKYVAHTRFDMNYLCALAQDLAKSDEIKKQLKYFPNSSLYSVGRKIRYIEYNYKNARRIHQIVAVDYSEYIQKILIAASNGAHKNQLASLLIDDDISSNEAKEFIQELIDSQLLISEIEPAITGKEFLEQIITTLMRIQSNVNTTKILTWAKESLTKLDQYRLGARISKYYRIANQLKSLETKFELKYLFQTDMSISTINCTLNEQIARDIHNGLEAMNRLTLPMTTTTLTQFRDSYYERYEDREMPLVTVLDTEVGIGYLQNRISGDISPLIDDLILPNEDNDSRDIKWTPIRTFLLKKYTEAISNNKYEIEIEEDELTPLKPNWNDLPDTISTLVNILDDGKIQMRFAGGSSAANLLGRFCHANHAINNFVNEITSKEEELNPDAIIAEIIHLPESRIGNILLRPVLRDYEIPYLARSSVENEFQINVQDLMISVKNNRIVLRSKQFAKEIIPRLSTAHNYALNGLPIYEFLCDLQTQNIRGSIGFNWGILFDEPSFLPRVKYKNLIFSPATWNIKKNEISAIISAKNDQVLRMELKKMRVVKNIPDLVLLVDGDNELLINLGNLLCIKSLISLVKGRQTFKLIEFLFNSDKGTVRSREGVFTNEFIVSFYKYPTD